MTFLPSVPALSSASLITASISGCGVSQARIVSASRSSAFFTVSFLAARSKLRSTLARLVPLEPAWINSGFLPEGSIDWWECPRNATSTASENSSALMPPSCTSAMTTSASPLLFRFSASSFVVATGSFQVMPSMDFGLTRFGMSSVMVPTKATFAPSRSLIT